MKLISKEALLEDFLKKAKDGGSSDEAIQWIKNFLDEQEVVIELTPVEERLPEELERKVVLFEGKLVIANYDNGERLDEPPFDPFWIDDHDWLCDVKDNKVTHWVSYPETMYRD